MSLVEGSAFVVYQGDLRELRRGGEAGQGREAASLHPGPSGLPGAGRGQAVQRGVPGQPDRPGDLRGQALQLAACVGRVGRDADLPAGQRSGQPLGHAAGEPQP
jgi:hypothetical protein